MYLLSLSASPILTQLKPSPSSEMNDSIGLGDPPRTISAVNLNLVISQSFGTCPIQSMPQSFILRMLTPNLAIVSGQVVHKRRTADKHKFCFFKSDIAFKHTICMSNSALITRITI